MLLMLAPNATTRWAPAWKRKTPRRARKLGASSPQVTTGLCSPKADREEREESP